MPVVEAFETGIQQRALAEVLLLSIACGPLGVWVVTFRQAYAAESLAHAMLPGLVGAALLGIPLLLGGALGLLVGALAVAAAGRDERLGPDTAVAVAVTGLFGLGTLLALAPEAPPRLQELLFGDLLGVTRADLAAAGALAGVVGVALVALHRRLAVAAFDSAPGRAATGVLILLALATAIAVQGLGNLLVVALLVAPGAAALAFARRLVPALLLSVGLAAAAGILGLLLSYHAGTAAGASVALCAVAVAALAVGVSRLRAGIATTS
jgi:ABC-type Mn2+/Zn2+ transport system permease subunit